MSHNKRIFIFENSFILANSLVKKFVQTADFFIKKKGSFNVALTGGKSIVEFYSQLAGFKKFSGWDKTNIFLTDERFVPEQSPQSNFRMIKEILLNDVGIPKGNIYPIDTKKENVFLVAQNYERLLRSKLPIYNEQPQFDLILLSLGQDGHVASLFPPIKELPESRAAVVAIYPEHLKTDRISLSMAVLNNAKMILCLAIGIDKAKALQYIVEKKEIPAAKLLGSLEAEVSFFVDKEAAYYLKNQSMTVFDQDSFFINL